MAPDETDLARPFLRWAGGKRHLARSIIPLLGPLRGRYFEPFLGAGAVLLALPREIPKVGSDTNAELIASYEAIRTDVSKVITILESLEQTEETYYEVRSWDRNSRGWETVSASEKAARMIFLNRLCFNGLYRVNAKNQFNVPWGNRRFHLAPEKTNLVKLSAYLNSPSREATPVDLQVRDYLDITAEAKAGDAVYFDPPYDPISKSASFVSYQAGGFTRDDQRALRDAAQELGARGVKVVVSNSDTSFIRSLYSDVDYFDVRAIESKRPIAAKSSSRQNVSELLITSSNLDVKGGQIAPRP